jgi:regulator of protease activity HflC (stomatin/prohibitin superfamily)
MSISGRVKNWFVFGGILLIVVIILSATIRIVPPGHTGVRVFAGEVRGQVSEGLNIVAPFIERMQMMNNRTVAMEMTTEVVTRDLQAVRMNYIVNYQLNSDASSSVFQTIGTAYESVVLRPIVEETLKDITARYAIEELITERARVSADITSTLQFAFTGRGFTLERFNIVDFQFSREFATAIESVRIAEQNALRAEQDLERVKFEAEARRENARAQADVLHLQARELTDTNLMAMWIEKWNGVVPLVVAGDDQGFMINLDDIQNYAPPVAGGSDASSNSGLLADNERMREYIEVLIAIVEELGVEVDNPFGQDN